MIVPPRFFARPFRRGPENKKALEIKLIAGAFLPMGKISGCVTYRVLSLAVTEINAERIDSVVVITGAYSLK
jgi:hypothetical protein